MTVVENSSNGYLQDNLQTPAFSVCPAGVRQVEGLHADSSAKRGEDKSGWSAHVLLCTHQQEDQHLSLLFRRLSVHSTQIRPHTTIFVHVK